MYEDNIHDGYWLRLGISKSDPLQNKRTELLTKLSLPSSGEFYLKNIAEPVQGQLIGFLRIFNMSEGRIVNRTHHKSHTIFYLCVLEDLNKWLKDENLHQLENVNCDLIGETLEKKSWNFLLARLKLLLAAYKTSLEEDERIIANQEASANRLLAVRMRAVEKRILKNAVQYVQRKIE